MLLPYERKIIINQLDTNHIKETYDFVLLEELDKEEETVEYNFVEVAPVKITIIYRKLYPYEFAIADIMNYPDEKKKEKYWKDFEKGKEEAKKQGKWLYVW